MYLHKVAVLVRESIEFIPLPQLDIVVRGCLGGPRPTNANAGNGMTSKLG